MGHCRGPVPLHLGMIIYILMHNHFIESQPPEYIWTSIEYDPRSHRATLKRQSCPNKLPTMAGQENRNAYVLGVGMAAFLKPRATRMYTELAFEAGVKAMLDGHVTYDDVEAGVACYTSGPTCSGQRVFYQFGMTEIPIYNTNNACATGSTGLHLAQTFVKAGTHDCVLVVGFEQMQSGPLVSKVTDRPTPFDLSEKLMQTTRGRNNAPKNPQMFGNAGREYMEKSVHPLSSPVYTGLTVSLQIWCQGRGLC